jgi:hypothetical protein
MNKKQLLVLLAFGFGWLISRPRQTPQNGGIPLISDLYTSITDLAQTAENRAMIMTTGQTCGERNNNPGNIRPAGYTWKGQTGTAPCGVSGTFVVFSEPRFGIRAIAKDLLTKFGRGLNTVRKIVSVYAPPSENDTNAYIGTVSRELGVNPDSELNLRDVRTMTGFVYAIIRHENGRVSYQPAQIAEGVSMALTGK